MKNNQTTYANVNKLKSHEIGQIVVDNWKRIEYVCHRQTDKVMSAVKQHRKYDNISTIEWTSPEGVHFLLFMDYRHEQPVLIPVIVCGTTERPQYLFPQTYLDTNSIQIDLFTFHFMERYRQRTIKLNIPIIETVKRFSVNNISNLCIWMDADNNRRVFAVRQGLVFAKADRVLNRLVYTTFVSNDMLGESQREAKAAIQDLLDRQDRLFNGTRRYNQIEWDMMDEYINARMKQLRPIAQEIYDRYFEDADD